MKKILILFMFVATLFMACEPDIEDFTPSGGDADFTRYVAIGNSLTSGYADGDLYKTVQLNSYPAIIAEMFATVDGGDFIQPLMKDDIGFGKRLILGSSTSCTGETSVAPIPFNTTPSPANFVSIADDGPFNNMGVPGAKTFHLITPGYGVLNPYFGRFATSEGTTVMADAMAIDPTFFSCWIGSNDLLTYALSGAESDSITPQPIFEQAYGAILQTLTANGAKGVLANLPEITAIPYFTTVPYNPVPLEQAQVIQLKAAYAEYNAGATAYGLDSITFAEGLNAMVIEDEAFAALGGIRQIKEGELVLLSIPQDSIKCAGWGTIKPVPAQYILDLAEIQEISDATIAFNQTIAAYAEQFGLALADMNGLLEDIKTGIKYDGVNYTATYVTGGTFSLDGVHLTPQGYAYAANTFVEAINAKYNAAIPLVSVTEYPGVLFP
ncbi:MAG: hypothetical protein U9R32_03680 [Bacteroidota bacterium]|nr:hypothetical protein [Bacteroidota bacterium]